MTTLTGKWVDEGELKTSCQSSVSSQDGTLVHPLCYLSSRGSQGAPCFPLRRQIEAKGGGESFLSLFLHALQFLALPSSNPHPVQLPPPACFACIVLSWYALSLGLFAESQSLCMCPLLGSAAQGGVAWWWGRKDSRVNGMCADGGRWKWDGLSGFLIMPAEKSALCPQLSLNFILHGRRDISKFVTWFFPHSALLLTGFFIFFFPASSSSQRTRLYEFT